MPKAQGNQTQLSREQCSRKSLKSQILVQGQVPGRK